MKTVLKALSISFLLIFGMEIAHANPVQRQEWRDELRAMHQERVWEQQKSHGDERQRKADRHGSRDAAGFESSGQSRRENSISNDAPDASRQVGKMSPEERRALRRQINEAGREIYAPPAR